MYVKVTNGAVDQYPYTIANLRRDNSNVSFPKHISDETLAEWGVYRVSVADQPSFNSVLQVCEVDASPTLGSEGWQIGWTVRSRTSEEQQEYDSDAALNNRSERDARLAVTDFYALSDVTMSAEMTAYRQALRDITTHANWPHLNDDDWPTKP